MPVVLCMGCIGECTVSRLGGLQLLADSALAEIGYFGAAVSCAACSDQLA